MKKLLLLVLAVVGFAPCTQIAAMEHSTTQNIPNNQIWYTSANGNVVTPNETDVFGATITSNIYSNGKGVITFDGNVTMIGEEAFYNCKSLTSVTIGDGVTLIGNGAFAGCNSLVQFNGEFAEDNGRILVVDGTLVAFAPAGLTRYIVPNSVTTIGDEAFWGCSSLTSITIPDSVTTIGDWAFEGCSSLTSVTIPDSATTIGENAFDWCESLTSVTIGDGVTSIGAGAFHGCNNLAKFKGKLSKNNGRILVVDGTLVAFAPAGLTRYIVPNSVTTIGEKAFTGCSSLTSVTIPDSVTTIGKDAFGWCPNLTSITIPDSVTTIGAGAFWGCSSLTSVTIPDSVTSIGENAFRDCYNLTSVTIHDSVTTIGDWAFRDCYNLTSVTIPDSVTTIGAWAFEGCKSLTSVYCKTITPPILDYYVFDDNGSGRKIYVPTESVSAYKRAEYWSKYASDIVGYDF